MTGGRIIFGEPWFGEEELALVQRTIESRWIGQGPLVERFEREFGAYVHADHAVTVSSCTAGLHLSLKAAGVGPGDEVITTPFTFVATVNAIEYVGARPRFVDINPDTLLIEPASVRRAVGPATKAIMPVSFGGRPLDLAGFTELADEHDLWVIEDAAHAVGAIANGIPVGASRHPRLLTCFSFYPNKNLASAEGGAITLSDVDVAMRLRSMRLHGLDVDAWNRYRADELRTSLAVDDGYKYNWTDLQAALAIPQLHRLEGFLATREFLAAEYDRLLSDVAGVEIVEREPHTLDQRHALHLYQVRVAAAGRDSIVHAMRKQGIGAALHYIGVNLHPRFHELDSHDLHHSDAASRELISLPLHPGLHTDDVSRVVETLASLL